MKHWCLLLVAGLFAGLACFPRVLPAEEAKPNLVANGSFEADADEDGAPDGWAAAGRQEVVQKLVQDAGRDGGKCARLDCTEFKGGTPDSHAMVCQVGKVPVERGKWYRLTFWVKSENTRQRTLNVAVSNTRPWGSTGISAAIPVSPAWHKVERLFRATQTVPAENTRLQFWFQSTGTLWLDEVDLRQTKLDIQYHPQLPTAARKNYLPNSSFECGTAQWGSYCPSLTTWTGNVFQLMGDLDEKEAAHGKRSLRMHLDGDKPVVYFFDYFHPIEESIEQSVTAHQGWVPVERGVSYTFSCSLKADRDKVPAILFARESSRRSHEKKVVAGRKWQRFSFSFKPSSRFAWTGAGLNLKEYAGSTATLWLDAVQFEKGPAPSAYSPSQALESSIQTAVTGNIFTHPKKGISLALDVFNASGKKQKLNGQLTIKDFFDRQVLLRAISVTVQPHSSEHQAFRNLLKGQTGFFRVQWKPDKGLTQGLRCAVVKPYNSKESPFGMNHPFPWDFLLRLCKISGMTWMRDWSLKWQTVEPERGKFDFSQTDPQIDRVVRQKLNLLLLFPFPSSSWSSAGDLQMIKEQAGAKKYLIERYIMACLAKEPADFRNYLRQSVGHYRRQVTHYEIMNEPVYTTYAVPKKFGYSIKDYIGLLQEAFQTVKTVQPGGTVVGGIGAWGSSGYVREFIESGGLQFCDVMDVHLYPNTISPVVYGEDLKEIEKLMEARKESRPIWLTEFGCYADDDPYKTPGLVIGDATMSRSNWPSERLASEGLAKTAAIFLSHGIHKIFFHAGVCGTINGRSGAGIFFEYGGTPRKMLPALSALANRLGPRPEPRGTVIQQKSLVACLFRTGGRALAIAWMEDEKTRDLPLGENLKAWDLMGNPIAGASVELQSTPVYFESPSPAKLRKLFQGN